MCIPWLTCSSVHTSTLHALRTHHNNCYVNDCYVYDLTTVYPPIAFCVYNINVLCCSSGKFASVLWLLMLHTVSLIRLRTIHDNDFCMLCSCFCFFFWFGVSMMKLSYQHENNCMFSLWLAYIYVVVIFMLLFSLWCCFPSVWFHSYLTYNFHFILIFVPLSNESIPEKNSLVFT